MIASTSYGPSRLLLIGVTVKKVFVFVAIIILFVILIILRRK